MLKGAEPREDVLEDINLEIRQFTVSISNAVDFWRRLALDAFVTLYSCEAQNIAGLKIPALTPQPRTYESQEPRSEDLFLLSFFPCAVKANSHMRALRHVYSCLVCLACSGTRC